jgi:hypothetical protein
VDGLTLFAGKSTLNKRKKMSRIYVVGYGQEVRLVRANTRAQALNHVAQGIIKVQVPTQDELVNLVTKGKSVESATRHEQEELPLEQA